MQIGIFARTFVRPSIEAVLDAVVEAGIPALQFNWQCSGLDPLPTSIDEAEITRARRAIAERDLTAVSLSGTFNMIHPDPSVRADGLRRFGAVVNSAVQLEIPIVTLCTGTRDPDYMWNNHPDNGDPTAWSDLLQMMEAAISLAEAAGVVLGVEPEVNNVVSSPIKARQLLDELQSSSLGIIMDGANVFPSGGLERQHEILDEAFELLENDIVLAHAKDISSDGDAGHEAAGTGRLDYAHYVGLLEQSSYGGPAVLHSLSEEQVPFCVEFLTGILTSPGS